MSVDDPTSREVLIALNAHVSACGTLQKINMGFMGAVLVVLTSFAGYSYVHGQATDQALLEAKIATLSAVSTTAQQASDETVRKLGVTPPAP